MKRQEKITKNSRSSDEKSKKSKTNPQYRQLTTVTSGSASGVVSTSHGSATSAGPATRPSEAIRQGSNSDQVFQEHGFRYQYDIQGQLELFYKHFGVPQPYPTSIYPGNSGHYLAQPQQQFLYPSYQNQMGASSMMPLQQQQSYHGNQNQHGGHYVAALPQPIPDLSQQGGAFMQPVQQHRSYSGSQSQQEGLRVHLSPEEQQYLYSNSQILQGWPDMAPQQSQLPQSDIGAQYQQDRQGSAYGSQYSELTVQPQQAHYGNQYQVGGHYVAALPQPLPDVNQKGGAFMQPVQQHHSYSGSQNQQEGLELHLSPEEQQHLYSGSQIQQGWPHMAPQQSQLPQSDIGAQYQQDGQGSSYGSQYAELTVQPQQAHQFQQGGAFIAPQEQAHPCLNSQNEPVQRHIESQRQFQSYPYNQNQKEVLGLMPQQSQFNTSSQYQQEGQESAYGSQYAELTVQPQQAHYGNQFQQGGAFTAPQEQAQPCLNSQNEPGQRHMEPQMQFQAYPYNQIQKEVLGMMPQQSQFNTSSQYQQEGQELAYGSFLPQQQYHNGNQYQQGRSDMVPVHQPQTQLHEQSHSDYTNQFSQVSNAGNFKGKEKVCDLPDSQPPAESYSQQQHCSGIDLNLNVGLGQQQLRSSTAATSSSQHPQQVWSFDGQNVRSQINQDVRSGRLGEGRLQQQFTATDHVNPAAGSSVTNQDGHNVHSAENPITVDASEQDVEDQSW